VSADEQPPPLAMPPPVRLVPASLAMIDAELDGRLAHQLGVEVPADWPPEYHDAKRLQFTRSALEDPRAAGWWLHYIVVAHAERPTLAGVAGYKGPPVDGSVEIGYSIVPSWQRRGLATQAARMLVEMARARGVDVVRAHTLPHHLPSIGVLRKVGFVSIQAREPDVLAFELS
jgi:ribosomal-protein-alanine N-acetyltransferase